MAERVLVNYEEERLPDGPHWTLEVQRSAAGQPGLLITIRSEMHDRSYAKLDREMTIVVKDGWDIVNPITEWLNKEFF